MVMLGVFSLDQVLLVRRPLYGALPSFFFLFTEFARWPKETAQFRALDLPPTPFTPSPPHPPPLPL